MLITYLATVFGAFGASNAVAKSARPHVAEVSSDTRAERQWPDRM